MIQMTVDFSLETTEAKRQNIFKMLKENPRILHPAKICYKNEGKIKTF